MTGPLDHGASCEAWLPPTPPPLNRTTAVRRIIRALRDGHWHPEPELRTTRYLLERMALSGLIEGAAGLRGVRLWRRRP